MYVIILKCTVCVQRNELHYTTEINFPRCFFCSVGFPRDPQTLKISKAPKRDSKVTFGLPVKVTYQTKVTQMVEKVTFEPLSPGPRKSLFEATSEPLFHVLEFFGVWGQDHGKGGLSFKRGSRHD